MIRKRLTTEQIIHKLREAEIIASQLRTTAHLNAGFTPRPPLEHEVEPADSYSR